MVPFFVLHTDVTADAALIDEISMDVLSTPLAKAYLSSWMSHDYPQWIKKVQIHMCNALGEPVRFSLGEERKQVSRFAIGSTATHYFVTLTCL